MLSDYFYTYYFIDEVFNKTIIETEEDLEKIKQQIEQLREQREMVLNKIKK